MDGRRRLQVALVAREPTAAKHADDFRSDSMEFAYGNAEMVRLCIGVAHEKDFILSHVSRHRTFSEKSGRSRAGYR